MAERLEVQFASRGASKVKNDMMAMGVAAKGASSKVKLLGKALIGIGAGVAAFQGIKQATRLAIDFEKAMAEVGTLTDTIDISRLSDEVKNLSVSFASTPVEQAKATYQIISAGAETAARATEILAASNKLAIGGVTDIATAADGLTSVMNAYGEAAGSATNVTDKIFVAVRAGKTTVDELSRSLGLVAPLAASLDIRFGELSASLATLTKGGIRTGIAVQGVRQIMSNVLKPTSEAKEEAQKLGIEFNSTALRTKGLIGFIADLNEKLNQSVNRNDSLAKLFGSVEALVPVLALAGKGFDDFNKVVQQMENSTGATAAAFEKMQKTADFRLKRSLAQLKVVGTDLGGFLLKFFVPVIEFAGDQFTRLAGTIKQMSVTAKAGFDILLNVGVRTINNLTIAFNKLKLVVIKIASAIAEPFLKAFDSIVSGVGDRLETISSAVPDFLGGDKIKAAAERMQELGSSYERFAETVENKRIKIKVDIDSAKNSNDALASIRESFIDPLNKQIDQIRSETSKRLSSTKLSESGLSGEIFGVSNDQAQKTQDATKKAKDGIVDLSKATQSLKSNTTNAFNSFITGASSAEDAFRSLASNILSDLARISLNKAFSSAFDRILGGIGGSGGDEIFGSIFGGARASGGPVTPNKTFLVGERGPELFTPPGRGNIVANHKLGGAVNNIAINTSITVNSSANDSQLVAQDTAVAVNQSIRSVVQNELVRQLRPGGILGAR